VDRYRLARARRNVVGTLTAVGGTVWAMISGFSAPIVIMAAFCTLTAGVYLGLVPLAYRALLRVQEIGPKRDRPSPEVWQHLPELRLYDAACLLADIEPDKPAVSKPGDANGWYRMLCEAIRSGELHIVPTPYDPEHTFVDLERDPLKHMYTPNEETVVSRRALQEFAKKRSVKRAFLLQGVAP
jgi:hypothetical protein